ncbi:platelet-activating factor acetylhydrolase [Choanephora cucurbitarum]|nr:platelet-activating factor acetylhydrolase [Choanephora cucurbitarum]
MALFFGNFPSLSGQFDVGCRDIEWEDRRFSKKGSPDCKSVFMRLYYPARLKKGDTKANWVPYPDYAKALCDLAKLPTFVSNWLSKAASLKKTGFYQEADMLETEQPFPVIVFSHGLGGNRLIYSCICSDLASHGFVVAAIEHREGSASLAKGIEDQWIRYVNIPPEIWSFRHHQLRYRVAEVNLTLDCLDHLAQNEFKGKLDMSQMVMAGHSFGGATTILMLNDEESRFQCGLLLDPWAQPLMMMDKHIQIKRPVIAILSEQFFFWPDNYESVQELIDHAGCASQNVCLTLNGTEHQHQSDVMIVLRYLTLFDFRSPFQIHPSKAIELNTEASVQFIKSILSAPKPLKRKKRKSTLRMMTKKQKISHLNLT